MITVRYQAQVRAVAGIASETVTVDHAISVEALLGCLVRRHARLRSLLLDDQGRKSPSLLVYLGDRQARGEDTVNVGDEVLLMTPIAGGGRDG